MNNSRRAACVALAALMMGTACRSRSTSEAGASASTAAAVDPCARVWRAAQVEVAFRETPEREDAPGPLRSRRFTVAKQRRGDYRYGDQWASVLEYGTPGGSGAVSYTLVVPDVLADLTGRTVQWESYRAPSDCLGSDGQHPALLAGDALRDDAGRLLVFTSPSLPLAPDGTAKLPPGLDFEVRWEEAGCTVSPEAPSRGVRLQVKAPGGTPVTVRVGETAAVELEGSHYEVRVASAQADTHGRCGQAVLAVYRQGLREQQQPR